jgi:hypothetical protein
MTRVCFDFDPILYTAGFVGEKRTIKVVHRESGDEYEFGNRTQFWGHHKKKAGGYLAEWNSAKSEEKKRKPEEFDITDVQTPEPFENCVRTMDSLIKGYVEAIGADGGYYGYSGRGTTFREDVSTLIKYKGNRDGALRPVHLDQMKEYLINNHDCRIVTGIEADDACSIDSYSAYKLWKRTGLDKDKLVLAYVDKDYLQCAGHLYNTMTGNGIDTYGEGFGSLFIDTSGKEAKVRGRGRMWLYYQTMNGDDADNYFANVASPVKWADMSAYNVLKDAKNDKEALEAMVRGYKTLYPAPKTVKGWRGEDIDIDWLYVMRENFTLARMLRWEDDKVDVLDVMDKLGVKFDGTA